MRGILCLLAGPLVPAPKKARVDAPDIAHIERHFCPAALATVTTTTPKAALQRLEQQMQAYGGRERWAEFTRIQALVGSCPRSIPSVLAGVRCWFGFAQKALGRHGRELPPTADELLSWSSLFRHEGTFSNYLGHVKLACQIAKAPTGAFSDSALRRAKAAISKRSGFKKRPKMFLRQEVLRRIMLLAVAEPAMRHIAMLFACAYIFLLRVPSEALPIAAHSGGGDAQAPVLTVGDGFVHLHLHRRKNKQQGSSLRRNCWCRDCKLTCPVHVLGRWFKLQQPGSRPFKHISPAGALSRLRLTLAALGIEKAQLYRHVYCLHVVSSCLCCDSKVTRLAQRAREGHASQRGHMQRNPRCWSVCFAFD